MDRQVDHVSPTSRKVINHESVMSQGIVGTVSTVLMQCSPDIGKVGKVGEGKGGWGQCWPMYVYQIEKIYLCVYV